MARLMPATAEKAQQQLNSEASEAVTEIHCGLRLIEW